MILQRLAGSLGSHRWSAVVLEIAVLVIGIFVGLQANDWNQRRLDRDNDRRVLMLFVSELEDMLQDAADDLDRTAEHLQNLSEASRIALICDATDEDHARLTTYLVSAFDWRVPNIRPSGLAEISNSGTLERIGDPALSAAVGRVNQAIRFLNDSAELLVPTYHRAMAVLLPHFEVVAPTRLTPSATGLIRADMTGSMTLRSQETLCRSQDFLLGVSELISYYDSMVFDFDHWHRALEEAHRLAASRLP